MVGEGRRHTVYDKTLKYISNTNTYVDISDRLLVSFERQSGGSLHSSFEISMEHSNRLSNTVKHIQLSWN